MALIKKARVVVRCEVVVVDHAVHLAPTLIELVVGKLLAVLLKYVLTRAQEVLE